MVILLKPINIYIYLDHIPEIIRTYLKEKLNVDTAIINKIFPYHASNY